MLNTIGNVIPMDDTQRAIYMPFNGIWERQLADLGLEVYIPQNSILQQGANINEVFAHPRINPFNNQDVPYNYIITSNVAQFEMAKDVKHHLNLPCILIQHGTLVNERPENLHIVKQNDLYDLIIFLQPEDNRWIKPTHVTNSPVEIIRIIQESEMVAVR